jgi:hypothetical protein
MTTNPLSPGTEVRVRLGGLPVVAVVQGTPAPPGWVWVVVPAVYSPWFPGERLVRVDWLTSS